MLITSSLRIPERRRSYVRLIGEIQHALNQALTEEHAVRGLTRVQVAAILGKNKSFVTRKLSGTSNMTLETLADLAFALDRPVRIALPSRRIPAGANSLQGQPPAPATSDNPVISPLRPIGTPDGTIVPDFGRRIEVLEAA